MEAAGIRSGSETPLGAEPSAVLARSRMPRWPGPVLGIGGALLAMGALLAAELALSGELAVDDPASLAWLALAGAAFFVAGLVYTAVRQLRVRRALSAERYRGPSVLLLLALVLVLAGVLTAPFGADAAALLLGDGQITLLGAAVILLATQFALLVVSWVFVVRPRALVLPRVWGPNATRAVRAGFLWGLPAWLAATLLTGLMVLILDALGMRPEAQPAERAIALLDPWLVVLAIAILAPVAEEIFFRGIVFNAWLRERGRRWAYIGSAALFAVIHVSLVSLLPIFLLGLALAWIYTRTGSLLAPIAMHATVNGVSVALALLVRFDLITFPV